MSGEGDVHVRVPDEAVESSASSSKRKIPLLTSPLAGDSLLQMMTPLPTLPFELITEILYRLPVKSLMKFKCVCKPWNSLISDRKFARKHFRMSTMNPNLILKFNNYSPEYSHMVYPLRSIFTNANGKQIKFPLNSLNFHISIDNIVGSCNGILCLATNNRENSNIQSVLWNPSIRKYNTLPSLEIPPNHVSEFGFGYDHFTDSYKVVAVFGHLCDSSPDNITQVKVHTLGTNSWRLIDEFPYGRNCGIFPLGAPGTFISGTLNWLVYLVGSITVRPIVSLDLGTETYQEILQPDYGEGVEMVISSTLGVLRDCLCFLRGQDIWLMKEYGNRESWTKFATFPCLGSFTNRMRRHAFYIYEDNQEIWFMAEFNFKLAVYDSINGTLKSPAIETNGLRFSEIYVESLISPCS